MRRLWRGMQALLGPSRHDEGRRRLPADGPEDDEWVSQLTCGSCDGADCRLLTRFLRTEPALGKSDEWRLVTHHSVWECPLCHSYYEREWEVDWRQGALVPRQGQFIMIYECPESRVRRVLNLVEQCPDPLTWKACGCDLHYETSGGFSPSIQPLSLHPMGGGGRKRLLRRIPYPGSALQSMLTNGTDFGQERALVRRS